MGGFLAADSLSTLEGESEGEGNCDSVVAGIAGDNCGLSMLFPVICLLNLSIAKHHML
jgi:hypothetical protein